jgi:hypothetical protein
MSAPSIQKAKGPRAVATLETKLTIISDFEARKRELIRNVEADLRCYKEILTKSNFATTRKFSLKLTVLQEAVLQFHFQ